MNLKPTKERMCKLHYRLALNKFKKIHLISETFLEHLFTCKLESTNSNFELIRFKNQ